MNLNLRKNVIISLAVAAFSLAAVAAPQETPKPASKCGQEKPRIEFLNPAANNAAPFSEAVRVGNLLILSGQLGVVPGTGKLAEGGIEAEAKQALENIKAVLEKNGSSLSKVVKSTVMLADMSEFARLNAVYIAYFPKDRPARSAFAAGGLARGARVEIECWAVID